jgi:hypothetical protein
MGRVTITIEFEDADEEPDVVVRTPRSRTAASHPSGDEVSARRASAIPTVTPVLELLDAEGCQLTAAHGTGTRKWYLNIKRGQYRRIGTFHVTTGRFIVRFTPLLDEATVGALAPSAERLEHAWRLYADTPEGAAEVVALMSELLRRLK